ncbi:DUF6415 family natural product biosynthesis protein [Streptomyces sp. NPDC001401]|uniref:DUF6415 family natural product biosynthesis protein n=1 Tax=Streptomyces sp. NPDC001401 TaxID=3364570 RepID=UPI0036AF78B3
MVADSRSLDLELFRQTWTEALELTNGLPATVPDWDEVDRLTGYLRRHVELLAAELETVIEGQEKDTSDRETARWLLVRTRKALNDGPSPDHRTAAVRMEDLALTCRALAALCHQQVSAPALSG